MSADSDTLNDMAVSDPEPTRIVLSAEAQQQIQEAVDAAASEVAERVRSEMEAKLRAEAEEKAKREAEEEATRKLDEEEAARLAAEEEAKRLAEEEAARIAEEAHRELVASQVPRAVKLLRQRWYTRAADPAIDACLAGFEKDAYEQACAIFEAEIEAYKAKNSGPGAPPMPSASAVPDSLPRPKKARR